MKNKNLKLNKILKFGLVGLLFWCFGAIFPQNAFCYTLSSDEINKFALEKLKCETGKYFKEGEFEIKLHGIISDVTTNETLRPEIEISKTSSFSPVSYRRITIKNSKGEIVKTFPLNIQILVYKNVLTAKENIGFNQEINSTNTEFQRKEVSKIYDKVICTLDENSVSSKNIMKGNIIQKSYVKQKAVIEKNQNVDIVFQGKGVQVTLRGKALAQGALGDVILVRSEKYNKTYSARIDSISKVTVRI